jgi:hypothetical protein
MSTHLARVRPQDPDHPVTQLVHVLERRKFRAHCEGTTLIYEGPQRADNRSHHISILNVSPGPRSSNIVQPKRVGVVGAEAMVL